jgi:hypothetical protein
VKVADWLLKLAQSDDPHLGGREGVHPADDADAVGITVRLNADGGDFIGSLDAGFEDEFHWQAGFRIETFGDFLAIGIDLTEGFRTVEVLASGDEPDFTSVVRLHGV